MPAIAVNPPFPLFTDADGQPLDDAYIYIGAANQNPVSNPITVYWDAALTIPASQPIRTSGGYPVRNGTPARFYTNSDYSILVRDKNGAFIYSASNENNLISSEFITFAQAGAGAIQQRVQSKFFETISVTDYGADPTGATDSAAAILAAFNRIRTVGGGVVEFPNFGDSTYMSSYGFVIPSNCIIRLNGCTLRTTTNWNQAQPTPPANATYRAFFCIIGSLTNGATLTTDTENIAIVGDNAVLDMRYDEQTGTRAGSSGVLVQTTPAPIAANLWRVHDIIIENFTVKNSLWYSYSVTDGKNVIFQNCKSVAPWQLGFVVVSGWNVSFFTCEASYSRNGAGNQGVGFWNEANETWQLLRNIRYYNCLAEYNNRAGFRYYNDGKDVEVSVFVFGNISRFNQWDTATNTQYASTSDAGHVIAKSLSGLSDHLIKLVGCVAEEEFGAGFKVIRVAGGTARQNFILEDCVAYNCNKQNLTSFSRSPIHVSVACDSRVYISNPLVIAPAANTLGYAIGLESSDNVYLTTPRFSGTFAFPILTGATSGLARKRAGWDVAWDDYNGGHTGDGTRFYKPIRLASFDQTAQPVIGTDTFTNELAIWQTDADEFVGLYTRDDSLAPAFLDFRRNHRRLRGVIDLTGGAANIAAQGVEIQTVTVTGAALGDYVEVSYTVALNNALILAAQVTAANTVTVRIHNPSTGIVSRAAGYVVVNVIPNE